MRRLASLVMLISLVITGCGSTRIETRTVVGPTVTKVVNSPRQTARIKHLEAELKTTKTYLATDQARAAELQDASEAKKRTTNTRPSGLYGGQTKAENEEAGCKYGFTVSDTTPHCNTQEEGIRIQEDDRSEREDPAREAENEAITEEDRGREECDERLGVNAC
jgi:hypothetical protein